MRERVLDHISGKVTASFQEKELLYNYAAAVSYFLKYGRKDLLEGFDGERQRRLRLRYKAEPDPVITAYVRLS